MTLALWLLAVHLGSAAEPDAVVLVPFDSEESMDRLSRARDKVDFFALAVQFESQQNGGLCGPTTSVIVLNTLRGDDPRFDKPMDPTAFPEEFRAGLPPGREPVFKRYTQRTFLDERFESVKSRAAFYGVPPGPGERPDPGLQLRQLHGILEAHGLASEIHVVDDAATTDAIRADLRANLGRPDDYVVVNYSRPSLGQEGGGHISPLGAYDKKSDSFLILDVNPNGHPWVWVETEDLVAAMRTPDRVENRGYLLVREGPAP